MNILRKENFFKIRGTIQTSFVMFEVKSANPRVLNNTRKNSTWR